MRTSHALGFCGSVLVLAVFAACGGDDESKTQVGGGTAGSAGSGGKGGSSGNRGGSNGEAGSGDGEAGSGDGGTSSAGAGNAGEGAAAGDTGSAGAGGAPGEVEVIGAYVDCENGSDDNDGTEPNPLKTLTKATTVATSGTTIVVLDGLCDETTQPEFNNANDSVEFPDGLKLRAETNGGVTFHGVGGYRSAGIKFLGSGSVTGIHFEALGTGISASSGILTVTETSFNDVYQGYPLDLSGTVVATISPGSLDSYIGDNQRTFARVQGSAKLTVLGGNISGALDSGISGAALFMVYEDGELVLDAVTMEDNDHNGVVAVGSSRAVIQNGSLIRNTGANACCNQTAVHVGGTAEMEIIDSAIENSPSGSVLLTAGTPSLKLVNSNIVGGASAAINAYIYSESLPTVTIEGSTISNNGNGLFFNYDTTLDIEGSFIEDNNAASGRGIALNFSQVNNVKLRNTVISGHGYEGVQAYGTTGSVFDFGRGNDLGGNTLAGNTLADAASTGNVTVLVAANMTVYAAGNTWDNVQAAVAGEYAVSSGNVLDVSGTAPGPNYAINGADAATTTLRLAEDACVPTNSCN